MELYLHRTDGGAEYYTTEPDNLKTTVLRTDGDELEIMSFKQLSEAGFKTVVFKGKTYDIEKELLEGKIEENRANNKFGVFPISGGDAKEPIFLGTEEECNKFAGDKEEKGELLDWIIAPEETPFTR